MAAQPCVSVIIPTWNRRELLREVIESLWRQSLPPEQFEVIVVDDASSDGTDEMIRTMQQQSPCTLRYERMNRNRGATHARNVGARIARGEILAFTDSDCAAGVNWLRRGVEALQGKPTGFISGAILDKPGQPATLFSVGAGALPGENPTYPTANVMYRAEVFWAVGGFDESAWFSAYKDQVVECGDSDLAWRTIEHGYQNAFVPEMIVFHEVRQLSLYRWMISQLRFRSIPELARRHPGFRERFFWWGPFALRDNFYFYLAVLGVVLGLALNASAFLLATPVLYRVTFPPGMKWSLRSVVRTPIRAALLLLRTGLITSAFLYGSLCSRNFAL